MGTSVITKLIGNSLKLWADATQKRLAITSQMLSQMKVVKMMGLSETLSKMVQDERVKETKRMEEYAWIMVWKNVIGKPLNDTI